MNTHRDSPGPPGRLAHLGLLRFAGPDAAAFLQGQVSNDTRRLSAGSPLLAAYSTPQGRVAALLHLLPHTSGILALLPREIVLPTLERLRKFVLRAKVRIEDLSERWSVAGVYGADAPAAFGLAAPEAPGYVECDGIGIARCAAHSTRYWVVGETDELARRGLADFAGPAVPAGPAAPADHATSAVFATGGTKPYASGSAHAEHVERSWRLADIREGLPQIYAATREMFVAQMLNLDLLDGISFTKGCFTGQEIIARTQHLGRIKRRMFRLRLPQGTWALGQAVHLADGRSGRLTELVRVDEGCEALAVLTEAARDGAATAPAGEAGARSAGIEAAPDGVASMDSPAGEEPVVAALELPLPYALTRAA